MSTEIQRRVRTVVAVAYVIASAGMLTLAFADLRFDEWAIVGAAGATLICLAVILATGNENLWLGVGAAWIYAAMVEIFHASASNAERAGMALVFLALAVGALARYTAWRWELL